MQSYFPADQGVRSVEAGLPDPGEQDLIALASALRVKWEGALLDCLSEGGFPDILPRHGAILAYLIPEGRRATEFSTLSGLSKQKIGMIADELEALGYLTRAPDPSDRRAKLLVPTKRGLSQMRFARSVVESMESGAIGAIGESRFVELKQSLLEIADLPLEVPENS
ncbi:MarR family transcriptional regulator [Acaricomes phytoseiuli]|uniref:MarR family winged helix-turn-helix transcriptional regulator n=1 Tax=Acaricomes phytoseiuli TaxID=291968 RepID=UPI0022221B99|nr:MarR family winged helix-turn-helix transcriptional regulator [Acaricomes phytoseiuli]MCW1250225.1 MarR family transcriptional regulator [Acaricomes phytoseiuli]